MTLGTHLLSILLATAAGPIATTSAPDGGPPPAARRLDPCALLKPAEIEAVQGERTVDAKSSRPERGLFAVSQCFFTLPTFSRSISLEVTRRDPARAEAASPRDHWMTLFHADPGTEGKDAGEKRESGRPVPVQGIGDEAFWSGDGVVGALYVLKGDAYLRLSLGGAEDASQKIEKSKALAAKALRRL